MNQNIAIIVGRITSEIKLTTVNDSQVAKFGVATNKTWKDKGGNKQEKTTFHNITAWGAKADVINKWFHKGDEIFIKGEIVNTSKEGEDGKKVYYSSINLDEFDFGQKSSKSSAKENNQDKYEAPIDEQSSEGNPDYDPDNLGF
jgi:single-strand DNA-binding protein